MITKRQRRAAVRLARRTEQRWIGRLLAACVLALLLASIAAAQTTVVTGTVTDPLAIPYANGTVSLQLVLVGGSPLPSGPTINGLPCCQATTVAMDANGSFTVALGDNNVIVPALTQWRFQVNAAGIPPPLGTGPQSFTVLITIVGASQSVTANLAAAAPRLTVINVSGASHQVNGVDVLTATPVNFIDGTNSTVVNPAAGQIRIDVTNAITGTGANTRLAFWTGLSTLSSDSGLTFDSALDALTTGSLITSGTTPSVDWPNFTTPTVGAANEGRVVYESATQQLRVSRNAAAFLDIQAGNLSANSVPFASAAGTLTAMGGLTWDNTNRDLTWAQGTITTSQPFLDHSVTFNDAAVSFIGASFNFTCTACAAGIGTTQYMRWQLAGNTRASFERQSATGQDFMFIQRNSANTASVRRGEFAAGVIDKFFGDGLTLLQWTMQYDPGTTGVAGMRFGAVGANNMLTIGGDNDGAGSSFTFSNRSGNNDPRLCLGKMTEADCLGGTGNGDIWIKDTTAAFSTQVTIDAGATQGTDPLTRWRDNSGTLLASLSDRGRFTAGGGAVVAGDLVLSAGWGATASVAVTIATSRDQALLFTVTSNGAGTAANPTITYTYGDGTFNNVPICGISQTGGTGVIADVTRSSSSATAYVWIWNGTPAGGGATYEFTVNFCAGT